MQFDEVVKTFARYFDREEIPFAVIGGLALPSWGHSRVFQEMTDIQHLVRIDGVDRAEVRDYFERFDLLRLYDDLEDTI